MRVLALDYGAARCGRAVSDPTGTIVQPLAAVVKPDAPAGLEAIALTVAEHEAGLVVIGLPRLASGEEGAQAAATRAFAGRLRNLIDAPVELYDERFTTKLAQSSQAAGATADEDSLAAAHLLEDFLRARSGGEGQ